MKIGDKLFMVNRDDRYSSLEDHNFNIIEVSAVMQCRGIQLVTFGNLRKFSIDPEHFIEEMGRTKKDVIHYGRRYSPDGVIVVKTNSLEDAAQKISKENNNTYWRIEDAKPELKNLISGQLEVLIRREKDLKDLITKIKQVLNEYDK